MPESRETSSNGGVTVMGSVNVDLVVRGSRLPAPGETVLGGEFYQAAGGKGANQAVAAARLARAPVAFIAAVGDDAFGRSMLESLSREGLGIDGVRVVAGAATGVALILVDSAGQNLISVASGANSQLAPQAAEMEHWRAALSRSRVALASLETPWRTAAAFLRLAKECGCTTILNPAPVPSGLSVEEVFPWVDIVTPNETEAWQLTGIEVRDEASALGAGRALQSGGCGAAIVTRGARGATVVALEGWSLAALPVEAVDATAAGDAFNGALAVSLAEGADLRTAVEWANRAAAISVTRKGAQPSLPRRSELIVG